jgi:GT2 family glycosyltransferase
MKPIISVIVPLWNHAEDVTAPFLKRLLSYTRGVEYELILVDNGSEDETQSVVEKFQKRYPNVVNVIAKSNLGFGGGNNLGYKRAKGQYICFISNDVMVEKGNWLKILYDECVKKEGLYGQRYIDFNQLTSIQGVPTPYITGYLMFGSKKMFDEVIEEGQIFDTNFGTAYFEDVDLSVRCKDKGYPLMAIDTLPVTHLGSKTSDQISIPTQTKFAQKHFQNKMMIERLERTKKKRVVIFSRSSYGFIPSDYEGKGVGGAEGSLILFAKEMARKGYLVEVYNSTTRTGEYDGVYYHHISQFQWWVYCDFFILFRAPERVLPYVNALYKIFWSCDQYTAGNWRKEIFPHVDKVVAISDYHAKYIEFVYGDVVNLTTIELGVNRQDYEKEIPKEDGKIIFCSVPRRGLMRMVQYFPEIKQRVPSAQLYITSDYTLWGLDYPDNAEFVDALASRDGVHFLGKVSRKELVHHQMTSEVMAYSCEYEECFCIAAMECIAAGAIPVTTDLAALKTTVDDSGILISNMPGDPKYDKMFVDSVVELLTDKDKSSELRVKGRKRALLKYDWNAVTENWITLFNELEKGGDYTMKCEICKESFKNGYLLKKHEAAKHKDNVVLEEKVVNNLPDASEVQGYSQLLKFKRDIEVQINGHKFYGMEVEVPSEYVAAVIETAQAAYGMDILDL